MGNDDTTPNTQPERSGTRKGSLALRGVPALMMIACLLATMLFTLTGSILGGYQGPVKEGVYYLENHGKLIPTTEWTWSSMGIYGIVAFASICLLIVLGVVCGFADKGKYEWYKSGNDYSYAFLTVVIMYAIILFLVNLTIH